MTTIIQEAKIILKESKKPLRPTQIADKIVKRGKLKFRGKTPNASVGARILTDIKRRGEKSIFKRCGEGSYALR